MEAAATKQVQQIISVQNKSMNDLQRIPKVGGILAAVVFQEGGGGDKAIVSLAGQPQNMEAVAKLGLAYILDEVAGRGIKLCRRDMACVSCQNTYAAWDKIAGAQ